MAPRGACVAALLVLGTAAIERHEPAFVCPASLPRGSAQAGPAACMRHSHLCLRMGQDIPRLTALPQTVVAQAFPTEAADATRAAEAWAARMPPAVFARVCKGPRLVKEMQEALPVLHRVRSHLDTLDPADGPVTVLDLCSGFGYLSMLLAETLPPDRVARIWLIDRAWPLGGEAGGASQSYMSTQHLQSSMAWRVPLRAVRCNIKKKGDRHKLDALVAAAPGPVLCCGIHLCGALSIRAVDLFNSHPQVCRTPLRHCAVSQARRVSMHARTVVLRKRCDTKDLRTGGAGFVPSAEALLPAARVAGQAMEPRRLRLSGQASGSERTSCRRAVGGRESVRDGTEIRAMGRRFNMRR